MDAHLKQAFMLSAAPGKPRRSGNIEDAGKQKQK